MSGAEFLAPASLDETLKVLERSGDDARPVLLAGGTDLWPQWISDGARPDRVVSLHRVPELRQIERREAWLRIGATCTHTDLVRSTLVQEGAPALALAAATVGAVQVQNRGTLGGNVVNASPAADLPPPLMAARAEVEVTSVRGARRIPLDQFFIAYRNIDMEPDELMSAVFVPWLPARARERFDKIGTRQAQAISKVVGACRLELTEDGVFAGVGLALGSVGPVTTRLGELERWLEGRAPGPETAAGAERRARDAVTPIDDIRSTADYRRHVVGRMIYRWIEG